jgi:hypothetical protein
MDETADQPRYPTNWGVRFLCDCKKKDPQFCIYKGIAQEISMRRIRISSDHHICQEKKVAMQVTIPELANRAPQKNIKIIGRSIDTIVKEGKFLSEISFLMFEDGGLKTLEKSLIEHFDPHTFIQTNLPVHGMAEGNNSEKRTT